VVSLADAEGQIAAEEARLAAQIAAGDAGAPVAELYRRYGKLLYRFGMQLLGDSGLAEEMVQECFLRLWRNAGSFGAGRGSVGSYLFVIALSSAAGIRKRPSSDPQPPVDEAAHMPPVDEAARMPPVDEARMPPEADDIGQVLDSLIVHEALDTLSPAHAEVLRLAQHEGLTQTQIAERLGLPVGTVKTRMFYGMQALRSALTERGFHAL
jgi:RNA polymerase sigma-70 factor, ECF subfamily